MTAKTIFDIAGASLPTGTPKDAALIVIDAQEEYRSGQLKLVGLEDALGNIGRLLSHWRENGGTVIHVQHQAEGLFDPSGPYAAIIGDVAPTKDEAIVTKSVPSSFGNTNLDELLTEAGIKHVVLAGFMTHVCVSTTARVADEKGFPVTVVSDATATRDLPDTITGDTVLAADLHHHELTMLADTFAKMVSTKDILDA
ncbi:MAG TPA: isochorismatase [Thalassospira lucentensis]|uniref:Isochorismatase n=1 Tax=Thalassospira lucentensis TaxID=168935 RepID=A0A3D5N8L9_9PROT|nr:cysteine hydrolase family protein [Thalassospira lucentensis]HCW67727.1 isochorismatase [Thalassospira lucentensis]|tara:strand:+ start:280 stop:873 length:594 start_codon:yes stop_codon:yes gene_type:complete